MEIRGKESDEYEDSMPKVMLTEIKASSSRSGSGAMIIAALLEHVRNRDYVTHQWTDSHSDFDAYHDWNRG